MKMKFTEIVNNKRVINNESILAYTDINYSLYQEKLESMNFPVALLHYIMELVSELKVFTRTNLTLKPDTETSNSLWEEDSGKRIEVTLSNSLFTIMFETKRKYSDSIVKSVIKIDFDSVKRICLGSLGRVEAYHTTRMTNGYYHDQMGLKVVSDIILEEVRELWKK